MRRRYIILTCNFLAFVVFAYGIWMLAVRIPGMPAYKLLSGLIALAGVAWNHFRWRKIARKISDADVAGRIDHLVVVHYLIILLVFMLVDFPR